MKMGKLPASCTRHNQGGKRLSAAIDDDTNSWEVHAVACKRMRLGPWPPEWHPCQFCGRSFGSAQALGGHLLVHKEERMALQARLKADAAAVALAAPKALDIQLCNETAAAAASSTPKIHVPVWAPVAVATTTSTQKILTPKIPSSSPVAIAAVGAVEMLRPPALSKQEAGMATLTSLLGLAPEELGTTSRSIPHPPPLLKLPLPKLVTTNAFIQPPVLIPPQLSQSKSSPVVLKHPHLFTTTGNYRPPQSLEFPLWLKRKSNFPLPPELSRSSPVMPSPPVSIAQGTFHPYQRGLVQLGRFSVMASAPLDLELRLGRSSDN